MSCCDGWNYLVDGQKINGECPDCGCETIDGEAPYGCNYSPILCKTCKEGEK